MPCNLQPCLIRLTVAYALLCVLGRYAEPQVAAAPPTIKLVNIIPKTMSDETNQDSEPNLSINPADPTHVAATAFTPDPLGGDSAPIFVSKDAGATWVLNNIIPSKGPFGTGDITVRFATGSSILYAGILSVPGNLKLRILRTSDFMGGDQMKVLLEREHVDQPYVQAITVAGKDRVFVGNNDLGAGTGQTATIEQSLDAAADAPPSGFRSARIETRITSGQDGPQIRPAISADGTKVYGLFYSWRAYDQVTKRVTFDLVIVRDDDGGNGSPPFDAMKDVDGKRGKRVVTNRTIVWNSTLGNDRVGGDPAIAVNPLNAAEVFIAWSDQQSGAVTLHVRRSTDSGKTWSGDLRTIANAKNPGLAVNNQGKVGFLYQKVDVQNGKERWTTIFERSIDAFQSQASFVLSNTPADAPDPQFMPYLGDYLHLTSIGRNFHGIFSANNTPDQANFPQGVVYQRNHNFAQKKLIGNDGSTAVDASIDPFFVTIEESVP